MHRIGRIATYVLLYAMFVGLSLWFTRRGTHRPAWVKIGMLVTGLWLSATLIEECGRP